MNENEKNLPKSICLALLPFWAPLIPPLGIISIRNYLKKYGFNVNLVDFNTKACFRKVTVEYFNKLREIIPEDKVTALSVVGYNIFRNHLMINQNCNSKPERIKYLNEVLVKNFYIEIDGSGIVDLDKIIDQFYNDLRTEMEELIKNSKPSILAIAVYEDTLPASLFSFKLAKSINSKITTIMGGGIFHDMLKVGSANFEYFSKSTSNYIDKIIVGEGELILKKLLSDPLDMKKRVYSINDINNESVDFSRVDYTDFSGFNLKQYPYLVSFASRSCPFGCKFCTERSYSGEYRHRNVQDVTEDINHMLENSDKKFIFFTDLLLNPIINELSIGLNGLSQPCFWEGYLRVDSHLCTKANTLMWRNAGFAKAMIGVESGSDELLKLMDKRIDTQQIIESIINLASAGIKTTIFMIVGYPGESEENFKDSLRLISKLEKNIYEVYCTPFYYYPDIDGSSEWDEKLKALYDKIPREILVMQTYSLQDSNQSREITYDRLHRLVRHCEQYGIKPNRFAYNIYDADKRWKRLHNNTAPSVFDVS